MTTAHCKLSGMAYHQGKPREHWLSLVGVDPAGVPGIRIDDKGRCFWTAAAESSFERHVASVKANWRSLGVMA